MRLVAMVCILAAVLSVPGGIFAGKLVNKDNQGYDFVIHWEDLSPATHGSIGSKEEVSFVDGKGILELVGTPDNIYVRGNEVVVILNGVMNKAPEKK